MSKKPRQAPARHAMILLLAWSCSSAGMTAEPPEEVELDEIIVEGARQKPDRSFKALQLPLTWMARLVGQFDIDGQVDLRGQGRAEDLRPVVGSSECVGFGIAPGVQCELRVQWQASTGPEGEEIPGGVSTFDPAVMLYGWEPASGGVSWIFVDNRGLADTAVGRMASPDTMFSRAKCVGIAGNCERVSRITARPDTNTVEMEIDLEFDRVRTVSYQFVLRRVAGTEAVVFGRKEPRK